MHHSGKAYRENTVAGSYSEKLSLREKEFIQFIRVRGVSIASCV